MVCYVFEDQMTIFDLTDLTCSIMLLCPDAVSSVKCC